MNRTLYIIDMQPHFLSAEFVISEVSKQVEWAHENNNDIAIVELNPMDFGKTYSYILEAVNMKRKPIVFSKTGRSGARAFLDHMGPKPVRVCGVNRDACVRATIEDFIFFNLDVEVACKATASSFGRTDWNKDADWIYEQWAKQNKIRLVK